MSPAISYARGKYVLFSRPEESQHAQTRFGFTTSNDLEIGTVGLGSCVATLIAATPGAILP